MESSSKMDHITLLIKDAALTSSISHKILAKDIDSNCSKAESQRNETVVAAYINKAISLMSAAKAIYVSSIETLERQELEDIFNKFDAFNSEFLNNFADKHSHQWTCIHYCKFRDAVEELFGKFGL